MTESTLAPSLPGPHPLAAWQRYWKVAAVAGALGLAATAVWLALPRQNTHATPAAPRAALSLTGTHDHRQIKVTWDPQSEELRKSSQVVLSILDGTTAVGQVRTNVALRPSDVALGNVNYVAVYDRVQFHLRVLERSGQWKDGAPLLMYLAPAAPSAELPDALTSSADRAADPPSPVPVPAARAIVRPSTKPKPRPVLQAAANAQTVAAVPAAPVARMDADPSPAPVAQAAPAPVEPAAPAAKWTPPFLSAVPIQQSAAVVPPDIRRAIPREMTIYVRLSIDEAGTVIGGQQLGAGGMLEDALFRIAVETARDWKYQPAQLAGKPVATIINVPFRFAPEQ